MAISGEQVVVGEKLRVLVTGAGALLGQGIIRSLRVSSLDPYIIAVDPDPRATGLYWADKAHLVPFAQSADYEAEIRRILAIEGPNVVLVGTDSELGFFSKKRKTLEDQFGGRVLVSSPRIVEIADDKWKTNQFLKHSGFPYPQSTISLEDEQFFEEVGFPLIVKPRRGARSVGVRTVSSHSELKVEFEKLSEPIIQEHVGTPADEYTAGAIVFDGQCHGSIVMRRELRDGNTYRAFVDHYPELNQAIRSLAEALGPHGPVNYQFRFSDDQVKVFEINARFSGTTPLRAHAGFNEVEMCLRKILWGEKILQPEIRPIVALRHWDELVIEWSRFHEMTGHSALVPVDQG